MSQGPTQTQPQHVARHHSLRRRLLLGILLPVALFIGFNTWSLYRQTLASLNTAYDRTLLASAKSISEQLDVKGFDDAAQLRAIVPYSALEAFEADNQSQMFYRVSTLSGEMVSGFEDLPVWRTSTTTSSVTATCAWPCCCSPWPVRKAGPWP